MSLLRGIFDTSSEILLWGKSRRGGDVFGGVEWAGSKPSDRDVRQRGQDRSGRWLSTLLHTLYSVVVVVVEHAFEEQKIRFFSSTSSGQEMRQ